MHGSRDRYHNKPVYSEQFSTACLTNRLQWLAVSQLPPSAPCRQYTHGQARCSDQVAYHRATSISTIPSWTIHIQYHLSSYPHLTLTIAIPITISTSTTVFPVASRRSQRLAVETRQYHLQLRRRLHSVFLLLRAQIRLATRFPLPLRNNRIEKTEKNINSRIIEKVAVTEALTHSSDHALSTLQRCLRTARPASSLERIVRR